MKKLILLCTTATAAMSATSAYAQSTGTVATEEETTTIVVTGTRRADGVEGVGVPDTTKAKAVLTQELIEKQSPGQTILNAINLVPGVNFTQSDPYGSSGGNIRIRGFDGNRISLTFDGVPLNDTGNYAIFSNQQLDPELIEQVNVGLGVTDVDSPTASAAGGTVNYRTMIPRTTRGGRLSLSQGDHNFTRIFAQAESGAIGSLGTRGWVSASMAENDKFKGPGEINKRQFNARLYQPIGSGNDFVSVSGHYNRNRNNFYRNPSINDLRTLLGVGEIIPTAEASARNPIRVGYFGAGEEMQAFAFENNDVCARPRPGPGAQVESTTLTGTTAICTSYFNVRINPSNTGNIRGQSRFGITDALTLTIDPSFQYVLANGGGISVLSENSARARGGTPNAPGVDYNGDGDFADRIQFYTPNNTNTRRYGLTSSLIWDVSQQHRVRVAYTFDRGSHRQTGEWGYMEDNGNPESVFGGRNARPVLTADGFQIQQRDRKSIALLNQISGQYIGRFFDNKLRLEAGVRRPFFERDLDQRCYTEVRGAAGFAYCTSEPVSTLRIIGPNDPVPTTGATPYYAPFQTSYKFGKLLPNLGFTYRVAGPVSVFGSYAQGFSAPRTDNLYRAPRVEVDPEETDAFDLGARYTNNRVQAQATLWKIDYSNRIVSSFDPDLGISLDRNVGVVKSKGFDGSIAFRPLRGVSLLALASYIDSKLQDNVQFGRVTFNPTAPVTAPPVGLIFCEGAAPTAANPSVTTCVPTAGKMVAETPKWQFGGRGTVQLGPVGLGIQGKRVGARFATDANDVKSKGYTLVDLDARVSAEPVGLRNTYLQFNVSNVFDTFYFGNISTQINASGNPSFAVGSPRTFMATLNFGL